MEDKKEMIGRGAREMERAMNRERGRGGRGRRRYFI